MSGSATINATTVAATISKSGGAAVNATVVAPAAPITDPYANNTALATALSGLSATGAPALSVQGVSNVKLNPGTWSSWTIGASGQVTLNPGLYVITGAISISGASKVSGTGVTIVHGGNFSISGSGLATMTAPTTTPTGNAVPGVLIASRTASTVTFSGGSTFPLTGVVYWPNAAVNWSGSTDPGAGNGCLELIAKTVNMSGAVQMASACSSYGAASTATGTPNSGRLKL